MKIYTVPQLVFNVHLDSLLPNTKYYYQVKNNLETSGKYSFVTASIPSAETKTTIVAMSDMQQDNANPNKFYDVVNNGVLNYFQSNFNGAFNEHLSMVLIPGDLVDEGDHHEDWVSHFFNQGVIYLAMFRFILCWAIMNEIALFIFNILSYHLMVVLVMKSIGGTKTVLTLEL